MKKIITLLKCILYALALAGAQYLIALLMILYKVFMLGVSYDDAINTVFGAETVTVTYLAAILLIVFVWLLSKICRQRFADFIAWGEKPRWYMYYLCITLGIGANLWTSAMVQSVFSQSSIEEYNAASSNLTANVSILSIIGIALFVPVMEEIIFRGIILNRLSKIMPVAAAVIVQGVVFGIMHGDPVWIAYAVFMGIVLGYVRIYTNSLLVPIIVHIAYNYSSPMGSLMEYIFMNSRYPHLPALLIGAVMMAFSLITMKMWKDEETK
ncbi:MAG: CPBP family intramembrane metalloprotease [Clostridia bacterium]|nr:CPBP family intramembrane metalloprotease [Clostridia bacterium]